MPNFDTTIANWLAALNINFSFNYLKQKLETHPDFRSMLSITDTRGELSIENDAIQNLPQGLTTNYRHTLLFRNNLLGNAEIVTYNRRLIDRFWGQLKEVLDRK